MRYVITAVITFERSLAVIVRAKHLCLAFLAVSNRVNIMPLRLGHFILLHARSCSYLQVPAIFVWCYVDPLAKTECELITQSAFDSLAYACKTNAADSLGLWRAKHSSPFSLHPTPTHKNACYRCATDNCKFMIHLLPMQLC